MNWKEYIISVLIKKSDYKQYGPYKLKGKVRYRNYNRNLKIKTAKSLYELIEVKMDDAKERINASLSEAFTKGI